MLRYFDKVLTFKTLTSLVIFVFGFLVCFNSGFQWMHPLDQSIVFDGAWRILNDQWFFDGFRTPVGFVPIIIQAFFFKLLGVSWWTYCVHSAVFNGLAGVIAFWLCLKFEVKKQVALLIGLLSTVLFYTPMATPYPDQHAFFFSLLAIALAVNGARFSGNPVILNWFLVPIVMLFAGLSKPVPSIFILPAVVLILVISLNRENWVHILTSSTLGLLASGLIVLFFFNPEVLGSEEFRYTIIDLPASLAEGRFAENPLSGFRWWRGLFLRPFQIFSDQNTIISIACLIPVIGIPLKLIHSQLINKSNVDSRDQIILLIVFLGLHLSSAQFVDITANQRENGIPFVLICAGISSAWISKYGLSTVFRSPTLKSRVSTVLWVFISAIAIWDTYQFHQKVNVERIVLDTDKAKHLTPQMMGQNSGLDGLNFGAAYYNQNCRPDNLVMFLKSSENNSFFLFGDMSVLYGLTGQASVSPVLWYHPGITIPLIGSEEFTAFKSELSQAVIGQKPKYVVFERPGHETYTHLKFSQFEELEEFLKKRTVSVSKMHGFEVYELNYN